MLNQYRNTRPRRLLLWGLALVGIVLLSIGGWAYASYDQEILNLEKIARFAHVNEGEDGNVIPISIDRKVLDKLQYYLKTPKGRAYLNKALKNMEQYRPMIESKLEAHGMPKDLLAIALVESGFRNLPESKHPMKSAGLWQFIPSTARKFGLCVPPSKRNCRGSLRDERLEEDRLTTATMLYFKKLYKRFMGNWSLAIASYNQGENRVESKALESGIFDGWRLSRQGEINDYLPTVTAGILILRHPELLN